MSKWESVMFSVFALLAFAFFLGLAAIAADDCLSLQTEVTDVMEA